MNLQEHIRRILREEKDRTKLIKKIIDYSNIFEYEHFCGVDIINPEERTDQYNFLDKNNVPFLIKVYFIGGPNSKVWPRTQGVQNKELDLMDGLHSHIISFFPINIEMMASHVNTCDGYDKLMKRKYSTDELQESIRRVLREEDYSPAGKEVTPNNIVIHKSNPMFRDKIMENGLKVRAGECYKVYVGYGVKCKPAIFATNSTNKRAWFDSTYDDDIWEINTEMIPDVKWYKDRHFESIKKHIVTFQNIPSEALTLKYEGSGRNDFLEESIRRILREETERNYIFVRTDDFDNTGTIRKLPYDGIHCWCIYEDDFDKYIEELELWGGSRKKVRIVDGDNYKKYAINYKMTHDYVMGDSDEIPELENFNPNKHIMKFIKQSKKSMLSYVADIRYQIILL